MALALYRKYRPQTFGEVIGQEHVTEPLIQALRSGRLNHAYLFSGPRGCGKTSSARILARSVNCAQGPTPDPCGECDSCVALAPGGPGSVDVIEIDAASHGGVDDARDLREKAFFAPIASRYKVYVIDEAHMVTPQGFNALLKLVEEPPEFVVFVFATTEPEKVIGTIRSRTHHYPFRLIPPGTLRPYLEQLCQWEGVRVEPAVFPLVVRAGGGSVRDSLSVLDQLIAGAGEDGVTYARAVALLGVTDAALIDDMVDALAAGDGAAAFKAIDRVAEAGHDPRRFAADLLERLRDLIVLQRVPEATGNGIIDVPTEALERMSAQAGRMGQAKLSRMADIVHNGLTEMRGTTAPRLLLELITARMLLPAADESSSAVLQRLERMERRLGAAEPTDDQPVRSAPTPVEPAPAARRAPAEPASPAPTAPGPGRPAPSTVEHPAGGGTLDAAAVRRVWSEVLTMIGRRSKPAAAIIGEGVVRDVRGDEVVVVFNARPHADRLNNHPEYLAEALHQVLGGTWRVRAEVGGDERRQPASAVTSAGGAPHDGAGSGSRRPESARTSPSAAHPGGAQPTARADGDWPETARPGGAQAASAQVAAPARSAAPSGPAKAAAPTKAPAGRAPRPAPARGGRARDDAPPPDEPPFDPDYDRAPADRSTYHGFDPGDEPLDDASPGVRESSEAQAMRAVAEHFAVERIGEGAGRA